MADAFSFLISSDDVTNRDRSSIEFDVTDDGLDMCAYVIGDPHDPLDAVLWDHDDLWIDDTYLSPIEQPEFDIFDYLTESEIAEVDAANFGIFLASELDLDELVSDYLDAIDDIFTRVERRVHAQKESGL